MKFLVGVMMLGGMLSSGWSQPAEILLLRHGEKPNNSAASHLSATGEDRSRALVAFFQSRAGGDTRLLPAALIANKPTPKGSGQRSGETLQPLSRTLHLPVEMPFEAKDYTQLARWILQDHRFDGKRVAVCWVKESLPQLAAALGVTPEPAKWKEYVYDEVYVITYPSGAAHLELAREGILPDVDPEVHGQALRAGDTFEYGGARATLSALDTLPLVKSEFTKRFKFDSVDNPKLKQLRERYRLAEVIAPGRDELAQQVLLMDWAHHQFKKFGKPSTNAPGALAILAAIEQGHTFFCAQFGQLFVSSAASVGWVDRELALRRHQGAAKDGSTEHTTTELWSNQYRKWVMFDPTSNLLVEKDGVPLNAYEIRQEWFGQDGTNLVFVIGKEHRRYRKAELPVKLDHVAAFGDLALNPDELDKYGFIAYIPNTDLMDAGEDYGGMFIVKDQLCAGTRWHERMVPAHPAVDPYFPIGQAALSLRVEDGVIEATLKTFTPNFKTYEMRRDGGSWNVAGERWAWNIHPGTNRLEVRTVNQFGVRGAISSAELHVGK